VITSTGREGQKGKEKKHERKSKIREGKSNENGSNSEQKRRNDGRKSGRIEERERCSSKGKRR